MPEELEETARRIVADLPNEGLAELVADWLVAGGFVVDRPVVWKVVHLLEIVVFYFG